MEVADEKNAKVGKESVSFNVTDELPVRVHRLFAVQEAPAPAPVADDESHNARMKKSLAHGKASKDQPTTAKVKAEEEKLKEAWAQYGKPPHSAQPMIYQCAHILQGARTEFADSHCSMQFSERVELCLKAEPYCKFFDKDFITSSTDIEKQADTWCGKAKCETSVEQLEYIEKECMTVADKSPASLLTYVKETLKEIVPTWEKNGCLAKVCTTLQTQAAQVNSAYAAYQKLGSAYASYANTMKLEGLVLYDLYKVGGC
jgi:hypothetical protein